MRAHAHARRAGRRHHARMHDGSAVKAACGPPTALRFKHDILASPECALDMVSGPHGDAHRLADGTSWAWQSKSWQCVHALLGVAQASPLPSAPKWCILTPNDPPVSIELRIMKAMIDRLLWSSAANPDIYTQQTHTESVSYPDALTLCGNPPSLEGVCQQR